MMKNDQRPDPDVLLARLQADEQRLKRGKLRIYFGASAGVGKTYAMLAAAKAAMTTKQDVLIGIVETHGRADTLKQLEGIPQLPAREVNYRGKVLREFDLDAALAAHPSLLLVDELAHTNAPGSRHPKRWQDVQELLDAGIDIYTTVNVQHLESLNDVVGGITGIRVAETLPDTLFDHADEVVLVDLPADELLARLRAGKIYTSAQTEQAVQHFFRKGNLIALRELALRKTANRIEDDVKAYRIEQSITTAWKTDTALLACIGSGVNNENIVRSTARLADRLGSGWHAVFVETEQLQRLPSTERERILRNLKLAQDLGAIIAVVSGNDIATAIVTYAHEHNFSSIVVGAGARRWWKRSVPERIARLASDIDIIQLGKTSGIDPRQTPARNDSAMRPDHVEQEPSASVWKYVWATAASLGTALIATPLLDHIDLANIVMLFLLTVVLVAVRLGRSASVVATVVSVASFDYFFVPPRFSFAVSDLQYLITFAVMLAVGLVTGHLTSGLRFQASIAGGRESRARILYEFARELSATLQPEQVIDITRHHVQRMFRVDTVLLLPNPSGQLEMPAVAPDDSSVSDLIRSLDMGVAQWAFDRATAAGVGTDSLPGSPLFYLPLIAPMRTRGVLAIKPINQRWMLIPEQRQLLETLATLTAIALERVHYVDIAQQVLVQMESERLRNSLLSALSHDLRTPLTALRGLAESLMLDAESLTKAQQQTVDMLILETQRMSTLVTNLLDMARIQSGAVRLNLQWTPIDEMVGAALRVCQAQTRSLTITTSIDAALPLAHVDAMLMERVFCNLLENAAKYTPPGTRVIVKAYLMDASLVIQVIDHGPGIPPGKEDAIFEKFTRGETESATPGVGLGLAICRAIVDAHHGRMTVSKTAGGGATFSILLPISLPPAVTEPPPLN